MKTEKLFGQLIRCYDNGVASWDRYTVVYMDVPKTQRGTFWSVGMSSSPFHAQGFGQHCTAMPGRHLGRRIRFADLPADCQKLVTQDLQPETQTTTQGK